MTRRLLAFRSLGYYWRTNLAVVGGMATAVAVLGGALVVGDSVRGTLYDLALERLGHTRFVVTSPRWFREDLAAEIGADPTFHPRYDDVCPLVAVPGAVTAQTSGRRAGTVLVYGVDERFWRFHGAGETASPGDREAFVSAALAEETGLTAGSIALVRVQLPSAVPLESLQGRKDNVGRTLRLTVTRVLPPEALGEFALQPTQGSVYAVFVPLRRLQAELEVEGRANTLLVSVPAASDGGATPLDIERLLRASIHSDDVGLRLRSLTTRQAVAVEAEAGLVDAPQVAAINATLDSTLLEPQPILTYLANTLRIGDRSVPYSLVSATDLGMIAPRLRVIDGDGPSPIVLNDWAARDLHARLGDLVRVDYYVWEEPGRLVTKSTEFRLAAITPVEAIDQDYAPTYRGISDSPTLEAWDPPFPLDLRRVRPVDEVYWKTYRTTPKAFIPLAVGQRLWASRYGTITSLRFNVLSGKDLDETMRAFEERLRSKIEPTAFGMTVADVRTAAVNASRGATDFGEYFLYFSCFLVVAALVLAALFFKLGVEQRVREVGLLRAVGLDAATIRGLLMMEAVALAVVGALIGAAGAVGYAWLVIVGLRTVWFDAVGTTALRVHVSALSLGAGAIGGILAATGCTWWVLRGLGGISERSLLAGQLTAFSSAQAAPRRLRMAAVLGGGVGVLLASLATTGAVNREGAFFGAGVAILVSGLCACGYRYRVPSQRALTGRGWWPISRLGLRNATHRPGRSVLSIGVIASATFILIAVGAFRREGQAGGSVHSGLGGYDLVVESLLPIAHDLETAEARRSLNLAGLDGTSVASFRLRPGDDASCLNLYVPQSPRILGASAQFIAAGRFMFHESLAVTDDERANPWLLLEKKLPDGAVPVIADANSLTYVLKRMLGDDIVITASGHPVRLRVVAALADSLFQRELVMADAPFRELFPDRAGYQVWLVDAPADRASVLSDELENALADYGADVTSAGARLTEFHRVENTYLSTFQTLGGFGLLLGTVGLGAVLLRNALERRRELALLGAVGYRRRHFVLMLAAESTSLLLAGLLVGAVAAAVAIAPAVVDRAARAPVTTSGALLLLLVLAAGLLSTLIAAGVATRAPLLEALRSE